MADVWHCPITDIATLSAQPKLSVECKTKQSAARKRKQAHEFENKSWNSGGRGRGQGPGSCWAVRPRRCYLGCTGGRGCGSVQVRVRAAQSCWPAVFVLGGGGWGCVCVCVCVRSTEGPDGLTHRPLGAYAALLVPSTFLRELCSFYLRKRDQPMGKHRPEQGTPSTQACLKTADKWLYTPLKSHIQTHLLDD